MKALAVLTRGFRNRLAAAATAAAGTVAAGIGLLATAAYLIVRADLQPPILELSVAIVGVRFFGIARAGLRYLERLTGHDAALRLVASLRVRGFAALERIAPAGLEQKETGHLLAGMTDDLDQIEQGLVRSIIPAATTGVVVVGASAVAWILAPAAGPAIAAGLAISSIAAGATTLAAGRRRERRRSPARAALAATIVDTLEGRSEALAYGRADDLMAKVAAADDQLTRLSRAASWSAGAGSAMVALGSGLTLWLVVLVGVEASEAGSLDPLMLGVLAMFAIAAFEPVATLPTGLARLDSAADAAARLATLEATEDPVPIPENPAPVLDPILALEGAGVLRGGSWHLRNIDLTLASGRRIAVVGASGAGKSTLIDVLMRSRCLDEGGYLVGGRSAEGVDPAAVREMIALAEEDAPLLDASLADNVALGRRAASPAEIEAACTAMGLAPLLARLPEGTATRVGSRGAFVSGGERRRIALARALVSERPLLILDEPTAGLEPALAAGVLERLIGDPADRGILLITHDAVGLEAMDEVLVLSEGRIVERGTHQELLNAQGSYAELRSGDGGRRR